MISRSKVPSIKYMFEIVPLFSVFLKQTLVDSHDQLTFTSPLSKLTQQNQYDDTLQT